MIFRMRSMPRSKSLVKTMISNQIYQIYSAPFPFSGFSNIFFVDPGGIDKSHPAAMLPIFDEDNSITKDNGVVIG